jgi:hypothetical protein
MENKGREETFLRAELRIAACPPYSSNAVSCRLKLVATRRAVTSLQSKRWFSVHYLRRGRNPNAGSEADRHIERRTREDTAGFERWAPIIRASGFKPDQ